MFVLRGATKNTLKRLLREKLAFLPIIRVPLIIRSRDSKILSDNEITTFSKILIIKFEFCGSFSTVFQNTGRVDHPRSRTIIRTIFRIDIKYIVFKKVYRTNDFLNCLRRISSKISRLFLSFLNGIAQSFKFNLRLLYHPSLCPLFHWLQHSVEKNVERRLKKSRPPWRPCKCSTRKIE